MGSVTSKPTLYDRLGGVYSIAAVVDDFIDRVMNNPVLNANAAVDEAHHRVSAAGFKYYVTEMVCWATGGPQKYGKAPGPFSLDGAVLAGLRRSLVELSGKPAFNLEGLPRVVIVGAGFGGISCARALRHAAASITVIDRQNYHLFQPLLYQVATAALSPADIAVPIRAIFRDQFNAKVMLATVTGVDISPN